MWGIMVRIQGAQVDASVPAWLMNAAASRVAINQIRRAAHELATHSDQYGFDPTAVYTLFVQTWDRAVSDLRSVGFGRTVASQPLVGLLPDPYFMHSRGYRALHRTVGDRPRWAVRSDRVVWRGSVTGDNTISLPEDLPRIRLALLCRDMPDMDVGLIGVHSTMNNGREPGMLDSFISTHGLNRDRWDMGDFGQYKFAIDIDGHANAWGFLEKLIVGCCVLKVESPYEQWFYDRLKPWHHYVPVRGDLSDLTEVVAWCRENLARCEWIAHNGSRLAASLTLEREVPQMCRTVLTAAYARQAVGSCRHATHKTPHFVLEDAAEHAEDNGLLNQAIVAYSHLIDAGDVRAETFMRRHDFLRQRGDFAAAQADLEAAVAAQPTNDEPALRLGQFLALIGRHIAAARLLEQTVALAPNRAEIGIALAGSCLKLGWLDRAYWAVRALPDDLPGWWSDLRRDVLERYATCREQAFALLRERRMHGALPPEAAWELARLLDTLGRMRAASRLSDDLPPDFPSRAARTAFVCKVAARSAGPVEALRRIASRDVDRRSITRLEMLFEQGDYRQVLDSVASHALDDAESPLRPIVAGSAVLLGRSAELIACCGAWMEQSPHDFTPAELVCGAEPVVDIDSTAQSNATVQCTIGQFWSDANVPSDVQVTMNSWTDQHPHLKRQIFNEESARAFLLAEYGPEMVRAFDLCGDSATKADYLRFAWLHQHGGLWVAVDQRCSRSVNSLLAAAARSEIATIRSGHAKGYLQDAFVAARAGSALMETALTTATKAIISASERGENLWSWSVLGPGCLTRLVARAICTNQQNSGLLLLAPMAYDSFASTVHTLAYKSGG
jgi:tetratricopeptide (TPR) repeat protein